MRHSDIGQAEAFTKRYAVRGAAIGALIGIFLIVAVLLRVHLTTGLQGEGGFLAVNWLLLVGLPTSLVAILLSMALGVYNSVWLYAGLYLGSVVLNWTAVGTAIGILWPNRRQARDNQ